MDSIERLIRKNAFDVSRLFNNSGERSTVYTRTEALSQSGRLVGFAYNALKEAFSTSSSLANVIVAQPQIPLAPQSDTELFDSLNGSKSKKSTKQKS